MLLVIQGYVDWQRIERRNTYLIHCSMTDKPGDIFELLPLPYDDELMITPENDLDAEQLMALVNESGYFQMKWWEN